jgi:DNA-binding response OmpR family regulator
VESHAELHGSRILVVEDEYLVALELADYLRTQGAHVIGPCHSLADALRLVARDAPDAAVLNVDINGALVGPVAEALKRRGVPFVFETGYDPDEVADRVGAVDAELVQKPYRRRDVLDALRRALESRAAAQRPPGGAGEEPPGRA